jgi:hypothetical protein
MTKTKVLELGERSGYMFTLTSGTQDSNAQYRISNITLDCETNGFNDISLETNTIHICSVTETGIGKSLGLFIFDGELTVQPDNIPDNYKRYNFKYFSPSSTFLTIPPGSYYFTPSSGYGKNDQLTGLKTIDTGVILSRKFRYQTFLSNNLQRKYVLNTDNNDLIIEFKTTQQFVKRNPLNGNIMKKNNLVDDYIPIITLDIRKIFKSKINVLTDQPTLIDQSINIGPSQFPNETIVKQISNSLSFIDHNIDYIFTSPNGKHMMGTQKNFLVLNGKLNYENDTSFNQSDDLAFTDLDGNIKTGLYIRDNSLYTIYFDSSGYGLMYDESDGSSNFFVNDTSTNIQSLIVPFGFNGYNFISSWQANIMGLIDSSLIFIHRNGWFTEQNINQASDISFQNISVDTSASISTNSITLISNSTFDNENHYVYVEDTSLVNYSPTDFSLNYIPYNDPDPITSSAGYFLSRTSVVPKIDTPAEQNIYLQNQTVFNNNVYFQEPSMNFVNTILDSQGHINTEPILGTRILSKDWVLSNAYVESEFNFGDICSNYLNYSLSNLVINDETNITSDINISSLLTPVSFGINSYYQKSYIYDAVTNYSLNSLNRTLTTQNSSGLLQFLCNKDQSLNTIKVLNTSTDYLPTTQVDNLFVTVIDGSDNSYVFSYHNTILNDQVLSTPASQVNIPGEYVFRTNDITLKQGQNYTVSLSSLAKSITRDVTNIESTIPGTIALSVNNTTISGFNIETQELGSDNIFVYDRFASENIFTISGTLFNSLNKRNLFSDEAGYDASLVRERNITLISTVSTQPSNPSYIDIAFDNSFSYYDFASVDMVPSDAIFTISGSNVNMVYDQQDNKFRTAVNSDISYNVDTAITIKYATRNVTGDNSYIFTLYDQSGTQLYVNDKTSFINMCLMLASENIYWRSSSSVLNIFQPDVSLVYNSNTKNIEISNLDSFSYQSHKGITVIKNSNSSTLPFFNFTDVTRNVSGTNIIISLNNTNESLSLYLLLKTKQHLHQSNIFINDILVDDIFVESDSIVIHTSDPVTSDNIKLSLTTLQSRNTHFITADNCSLTDNIITITPRDPSYFYDIFTITLTGNFLYLIKYDDSTNTPNYYKFIVDSCWINSNNSYSIKLITCDMIPIIDSTSYFYLMTSSGDLDVSNIKIKSDSSPDIYTGYQKIFATLPEFEYLKQDISLAIDMTNSYIDNSGGPIFDPAKYQRYYEKSYLDISSSEIPLVTLGYTKQLIPRPVEANLTNIHNNINLSVYPTNFFTGNELSWYYTLTQPIDLTQYGSVTKAIKVVLYSEGSYQGGDLSKYSTFLDSFQINSGVRTISSISQSSVKFNDLDMNYYADGNGSMNFWLILNDQDLLNGTIKITINSPLKIALAPKTGNTSATYKILSQDDDVSIDYVPQLSLDLVSL